MIDLRRDLFVRLAISAQKNRHLNRPFKVKHVDSWNVSPKVKPVKSSASSKIHEGSSFVTVLETEASKVQDAPKKTETISESKSTSAVAVSPRIEKIDEKVDNIINDPVLIELQVELEFAEQLLKKVRESDAHNPKIPIIEGTISRLRSLLEQKMYV